MRIGRILEVTQRGITVGRVRWRRLVSTFALASLSRQITLATYLALALASSVYMG